MRARLIPTLFVALIVTHWVAAEETVGVSGSSVQYPVAIETKIGEKSVSQKLTGAAMRKRAIFNVYTIGSYVQTDFAGKSAEELAATDAFKQLHLVMQRSVSGADMAEAFRDAVRANYPGNQFAEEMDKFMGLMRAQNADKGDEVWITHVPGYGLHVNHAGKRSEYIKSVKFAKAVWDIYLGPKNIGEGIKKALTSRL